MEDDIVELQVSGQLFKTYRKTLTSIPNSLLGTYFTKLENKSIFLDRNPKLFTLILEYYRTQYLTISNQTSWNSIWIEINYFKLHDVIQQQQIEFIPGMIGNEFDITSLFKDSINCMMACRFNDMIQLIIYNQIHDFKFQIDLKGNVIGIPEALNSIQSSKSFWKDFGKYFVAAPPGSKDDFINSFQSNFNINNQIQSNITNKKLQTNCMAITGLEDNKEEQRLSWIPFRIKVLRSDKQKLNFVDRRLGIEDNLIGIGLVFLIGWELEFTLPKVVTATILNDSKTQLVHDIFVLT